MLRACPEGGSSVEQEAAPPDKLACLTALERKVLWLSTWMIHNANHLRPNRDGLKVGGHQASSASVATLMTALYFDVLRPQDRVAVKPHAVAGVPRASNTCSGIRAARSWSGFAPSAARNPTRRAPRTATSSISRPARSGSASA